MIRRCVLFTAAAFVVASVCYSASGQQVQRRRQLLDQDWRFTKGDPAGIDPTALLYDARPVARGEDQLVRAAESTEEAAKLQATTHPVLKPWILPTGNSFIKDPAKRFQRPPEDPGFDIPYVRASFDDSGWSKINLPHDWAISGPFNSGDVGGGMGRLPSPGIGWYRKKLNIPLSDAGKSVFLEADGAMS